MGARPDPIGRAVASALDPVLVRAGFSPGQHGDHLGGGDQVIFCAGHDELSDAFLALPQADAQQRKVGACIDLVIDIADDGSVDRVDLEELSLAETLRAVGHHEDAELVAATTGCAVDVALPVLSASLDRLLHAAS